MAKRPTGMFSLSNSFEMKSKLPVDARLVIDSLDDLIGTNTFYRKETVTDVDGEVYERYYTNAYEGMPVIVKNDGSGNPSIYILKNLPEDISGGIEIDNWYKYEGGGGNSGYITQADYNQLKTAPNKFALTETIDSVSLDIPNLVSNSNGNSVEFTILNDLATTPGFLTSDDYKLFKKFDNSLPEYLFTYTDDDFVTYSTTKVDLNFLEYVKDEDGTYIPDANGAWTINSATSTKAGMMSAADKAKLDSLSESGGIAYEGKNGIKIDGNKISLNISSDVANNFENVFTFNSQGGLQLQFADNSLSISEDGILVNPNGLEIHNPVTGTNSSLQDAINNIHSSNSSGSGLVIGSGLKLEGNVVQISLPDQSVFSSPLYIGTTVNVDRDTLNIKVGSGLFIDQPIPGAQSAIAIKVGKGVTIDTIENSLTLDYNNTLTFDNNNKLSVDVSQLKMKDELQGGNQTAPITAIVSEVQKALKNVLTFSTNLNSEDASMYVNPTLSNNLLAQDNSETTGYLLLDSDGKLNVDIDKLSRDLAPAVADLVEIHWQNLNNSSN